MRRSAYAAIAVAIVCVSFATPLIKLTSKDTHTLVVAAYRMTFATLFLAPFALRSRDLRTLSRRDLGLLTATGLVLAVHFATWIASLKEVPVPTASSLVLVTAHPLLVAVVSHFAFRERMRRLTAVGIALGLCGVAVIGFASGGAAGAVLGNALALVGGVMAGLYLLAGRRLRQRLSLVAYAFPVYAVAAIALLAATAVAGVSLEPAGDRTRELLLFLGLAGISQIGGHTLYNWALKHVPATTVSVSLLGEPIGGSLLTWAILGEVPPGMVAVGAALALPGIFLTGYSLEKTSAGDLESAVNRKP